MTLPRIKKTIKEDLTPRYEATIYSAIEFTLKKENEYRSIRNELQNTIQSLGGNENQKLRKLYTSLYLYYDKEAKKQVIGTPYQGIPKKYSMMFASGDKTIKAHFTKEYNELLNNLVVALYEDIKEYKPIHIELGHSEHDINFTLTIKKIKQSYTINTVLAGGFIQVIQNRTLRKLHKGLL